MLGLLVVVAVLATLASKLEVPYPILLVLGGSVLGFVPGLPQVELDPELVFLLFLPPLLYVSSLFTSWRDFRANLRPISLLGELVTFLLNGFIFIVIGLQLGGIVGRLSEYSVAKATSSRTPTVSSTTPVTR